MGKGLPTDFGNHYDLPHIPIWNMELYVLRHAIAEERDSERFPDDSLRPLTDRGREKMRRIAAGIKRLGVEFDEILSSRYVRARQTAEIVAEVYSFRRKIGRIELLEPDRDPKDLIRMLKQKYRKADSLMLVGHEPHLGHLISELLLGKTRLQLTLKKGGLCKVSWDTKPRGARPTLEWFLTPKQLRLLAAG